MNICQVFLRCRLLFSGYLGSFKIVCRPCQLHLFTVGGWTKFWTLRISSCHICNLPSSVVMVSIIYGVQNECNFVIFVHRWMQYTVRTTWNLSVVLSSLLGSPCSFSWVSPAGKGNDGQQPGKPSVFTPKSQVAPAKPRRVLGGGCTARFGRKRWCYEEIKCGLICFKNTVDSEGSNTEAFPWEVMSNEL